jgi:competence protein ComEC
VNTLDHLGPAPLFLRAPAAVLLGAACAGILADRFWPRTIGNWSALAGVLLAVHYLASRQRRERSSRRLVAALGAAPLRRVFATGTRRGWALLGAVAGLAGAWHHVSWHDPSRDDLTQLVADDERSVPVLVSGLADSAVITAQGNSLPAHLLSNATFAPRTRFRLRAGWLHRNGQWVRAGGTIWAHVNGACQPLRPGDQVVVWGNLARYRPPMNPGEFNFQAFRRARGEFAYVDVPVADCVHVVARPAGVRWWLPRLRVHWQNVLSRELSDDAAPLAAALLLGARDGLSSDMRDPFLRTGTAHVLAISGLHVGILAAPWLFVARARLLHVRGALASVIVIMALYAALADGRAPVVRASVLVQVLCCSWLTRRRTSLVNSLGAAGLVVLLINPADLFHTGTQLSFLAVATLGRCHKLACRSKPMDPLDQLILRTRPSWWRAARRAGERVQQLLLASLGVWLVTAPLVVQAFHIVSPVAIPLNLVLFLPLAMALQSGFALLVVADVWPPLAPLLALVCQSNLRLMQCVVGGVAAWPGSHFWLVDPGAVAVAACYACVGLTWIVPDRVRYRWLGFLLALACLIAGWGQKAWHRYQSRDSLQCAVLSVGHGNCVVLQWPGGPVWLYDAGCRGSTAIGVDRVARYLWTQGIGRIDAMVLSHSDLDHYSLMPGLIERFGVRRFFVGPTRLRADDPGESWLVAELNRRGVIPEIMAAGDQFFFGAEGTMTVLHPNARLQQSNDNARSLVLSLHYQDMGVLLPGDLEADGLQWLLDRPPPSVDVVMAPHHGSLQSDPGQFLQWCRPRWCIISGSDISMRSTWEDHSTTTGTVLLHTAVDGAVEIKLAAGGIRVQSFRPAPSP